MDYSFRFVKAHGNGTRSEAMLFEGFDGTAFSHSKVLSLLAFCTDCAIILAFIVIALLWQMLFSDFILPREE